MSNLLETFRDEAIELIQELEEALLELEETPKDSALIDRVFRALHTLKGSGGLAGFDNVAGFCHEAETVFEMIRAGERQVDQALVSLTLRAQDHLKGMILYEFGDEAVDDEITAELVADFQALMPYRQEVLQPGHEEAEGQHDDQVTLSNSFPPQSRPVQAGCPAAVPVGRTRPPR